MINRRKTFRFNHLVLVLCCLLLIEGAGCSRPEDTAWQRVQETGILRVGMDASFPPFEAIASDGTLMGFDVDLARELGRRLGVEVHFVANLPYDGLYDALKVGRVDVVISALVVNPARMGDFAYSIPYFDAGQVLVVRRGNDDIQNSADLDGKAAAVALGTRGDLEARKWARRLADLTVIPYQTASEALQAVANEEADAALVDHVSALSATGASTDLIIVGDPIVEEPYAVAMRRDSSRLLQATNDALSEMQDDGTIETLIAQWLAE